MKHLAHLCARWEKRGMQCPFRQMEEEEEKVTEDQPSAKAFGQIVSAEVPRDVQIPWWLAIPLGDAVRRSLRQSGEFFDVLAAAEEIAATEARKIPVNASRSLFQALRPGQEVMGVAGVVAATAVGGLALRRFGGGRLFQATRFRDALATAQ